MFINDKKGGGNTSSTSKQQKYNKKTPHPNNKKAVKSSSWFVVRVVRFNFFLNFFFTTADRIAMGRAIRVVPMLCGPCDAPPFCNFSGRCRRCFRCSARAHWRKNPAFPAHSACSACARAHATAALFVTMFCTYVHLRVRTYPYTGIHAHEHGRACAHPSAASLLLPGRAAAGTDMCMARAQARARGPCD